MAGWTAFKPNRQMLLVRGGPEEERVFSIRGGPQNS